MRAARRKANSAITFNLEIRLLIIGFLLLFESAGSISIARAEEPISFVAGTGTLSCRWVTERGPVASMAAATWAQGFLSRSNIALKADTNIYVNLLPGEFPFDDQVSFISAFCRENPDRKVIEAVFALLEKLKESYSIRATK